MMSIVDRFCVLDDAAENDMCSRTVVKYLLGTIFLN